MSKLAVSAAGGAMTPVDGLKTRPAPLAVAAAPADPAPVAAIDGEAAILALADEVVRRHAEVEKFVATHIDPLEAVNDAMDKVPEPWEERMAASTAFHSASGLDAAIHRSEAMRDEITSRYFDPMMAIPATTRPARAAKVRALIIYVLGDGWRGRAEDLDWDKDMTRALLGQLAGMTPDEVAAI